MNNQYENINRHESSEKAFGSALYLDDLEMPNMAYGAAKRSPYAHCKVLEIRIDKAAQIPGVLAILLPEDVPQTLFNCAGYLPSPLLVKDQTILTRHPKHQGERIAAVAAISPEIALKAIEAIEVDYEVLPAITTIDEAIAENAPLIQPDLFDTNCFFHKHCLNGDLELGFAQSDYVFEQTYYTQTQHPIPLEPISCIVHYTRDHKALIWANTQTPYQDRRVIAELFDLPESDISIRKAMMGSGFGQRSELFDQDIALVLSQKLYQPIKFIYSRNDEMIDSAARHASKSIVKMGVSKDGYIIAYHHTMYTNAGPYCTHTPLVTGAASRKCPYRMPHFGYDGYGVYTNGPMSGAFRGYGNPQISFARESLINEICAELNWDSMDFRRKNICLPGEEMHENGILNTLPVDDLFDGAQKIKEEIDAKEGLINNERIKQAWGLALIDHCSAASDLAVVSSATITVCPDGSCGVNSGTLDMGQGSETAMIQVAAEQFGIDPKYVRHAELDTVSSPYNYGSFSSGQMFISGNAVALAAQDVIEKLRAALAAEYQIELEQVVFDEKQFKIVKKGLCLGFQDAIKAVSRNCRGTFIIGSAVANMHNCPPPFALCYAKMEYDTLLNTMELKHIIQSVDIGRPLNLKIVEGQLEGAIQMGIGLALMEDLEVDKISKNVISANLLNYRNPLITDMPQIHVHIADNYEPFSAVGAKGVGELGVIPVPPAIIDAANQLTAKTVRSLPLTKHFMLKNCRYEQY